MPQHDGPSKKRRVSRSLKPRIMDRVSITALTVYVNDYGWNTANEDATINRYNPLILIWISSCLQVIVISC